MGRIHFGPFESNERVPAANAAEAVIPHHSSVRRIGCYGAERRNFDRSV